jgi:hypothetical protein
MRRTVSSLLAAMVGLGVLVAVASLGNAATTYTFIQFDVPGSSDTRANGINDAGQIVGSFVSNTDHGFLRGTDGQLTIFDVPLQDINDAGQIVGGGRPLYRWQLHPHRSPGLSIYLSEWN